MNLQRLLEEYPWADTKQLLLRDAVPQRDQQARRIVAAQRDSQLVSLVRSMVTPVVATEHSNAEWAATRKEQSALSPRSPRRTARIFIDGASRVGKGLSAFAGQFNSWGPDDGRLARLLLLLALSVETPSYEVALMRFDWQRVTDEPGDLGIVLSPFVEAIELRSHAIAEVADHLHAELAAQLEAQSLLVAAPLDKWVSSFIREGATRLRELQPKR